MGIKLSSCTIDHQQSTRTIEASVSHATEIHRQIPGQCRTRTRVYVNAALHCETVDTGLVHLVVCIVFVFIPTFIGTHSVAPTHRGMARLS